MKIYFSAAISDIPPNHQNNYLKIVEVLKELGHRVMASHILGKTAEKIAGETPEETEEIYRKMIAWKNQADLVVIEASYPSFGVGQEITYSLMNLKPVIALHLKDRRPHLLTAIGSEYLHIVEYTKENVKKTLNDYLEYAKEAADTRFNFFISPEIETFLDWISKKRKVPRAVFLRQLLDADLEKNRDYLKNRKSGEE